MAAEPNCVFCRIASGELPASIVYEDSTCVAFLDINPLAPGHLVVIPRGHYSTLPDVPSEVLAGLARPLGRLGRALLDATGAAGFNVLQNNGRSAGQEVDHVHVHLIPRVPKDGLGFRWNVRGYGEGEAQQWLARLRAAIAS